MMPPPPTPCRLLGVISIQLSVCLPVHLFSYFSVDAQCGWVSREATEESIESSGGELQELELLLPNVGTWH